MQLRGLPAMFGLVALALVLSTDAEANGSFAPPTARQASSVNLKHEPVNATHEEINGTQNHGVVAKQPPAQLVEKKSDATVDSDANASSTWWPRQYPLVPKSGLVAWFQMESASPTWSSVVNGYVGQVVSGSVTMATASGNGASVGVNFIQGSTTAQYNFGNILRPTFTICSVTRYTSANQGRILQGSTGNLLHGHWGGQSGVVYYEGWMSPQARNTGSTNWVVVCGTNAAGYTFVDGQNIYQGAVTNSGGNRGLVINTGGAPGEVSDWAVMELITWDRALSADEMLQVSNHFFMKLLGPPSIGMVSWFKSEDASPTWPSVVGNFVGKLTSGVGTVVKAAGNGATNVVEFLQGDVNTQMNFGNVLSTSFTICSVTRYAGSNQRRILQASTGNFLHGHYAGQVGVAYYEGWQTATTRAAGSTDWTVVCGTNAAGFVLVNGQNIFQGTVTNNGGDRALQINRGGIPSETSDFAIMELITWNRALNLAEMQRASAYLMQKLTVSPIPTSGLVAWYMMEDAATTWPSVVNGYVAQTVTGITTAASSSGNGAAGSVNYVQGTTTTTYDFGPILRPVFTLCSVSRYTGSKQSRILQTGWGNALHGHWNGQAGVVYYEGWMTPSSSKPGSTDWVVVCGSNAAQTVLVNGQNVFSGSATNNGGDRTLQVNPPTFPTELSDWAVMEVITWNRALTAAEMQQAANYLYQKLT